MSYTQLIHNIILKERLSPVCGVRHSSVFSTSRMLNLGSSPHILRRSTPENMIYLKVK